MKVAIMQPYFLPYIGYWQLIAAVDAFVVYDNIKYTKKGWINRNRFLSNGKEAIFSLPLSADSDFLEVRQRQLAPSFDREALVSRFREAYRKAPHSSTFMPVLEDVIRSPFSNLFDYIFHSIRRICGFLEVSTPIVISSTIECDHSLKAANRVKAICRALGADAYVNPMGGTGLYDKHDFAREGLHLQFLQPQAVEYPQGGAHFVAWLSIVDVAMWVGREDLRQMIRCGYAMV